MTETVTESCSSPQADRAGAREHEKVRKKVRLQLISVAGSVTRNTQTARFWQPPGPWTMRPVAVQRRFIQEEASVLANLADLGIEYLHRRLIRTPWPARQWAKAHNEWADPLPAVPGALS